MPNNIDQEPADGNAMETTWSETQTNRLKTLDADQTQLAERFEDQAQRDRAFQELEAALA